MRVFKFGGASLGNADGVKNVASIIKMQKETPLLVVVSAMGRTTDKLVQIVAHYYRHQMETVSQLLFSVQNKNTKTALTLFKDETADIFEKLHQINLEMQWQVGEKAYQPYDYYYDQLVSKGEIVSSLILHSYLQQAGVKAEWLDVRKVITTDGNFRNAKVDWAASQKKVIEQIVPLFKSTPIVITQGFLGANEEGQTTTLGREGSDYSAALLTNMLDAKSLTIWKDVEGLKNADPRLFKDTQLIQEINYEEVIEMAYYGAHIIHPKTIKPLQNKGIPLYVKSFLNTQLPGSVVDSQPIMNSLPPIIVYKKEQVLITLTTRDFSFMSGKNLVSLYDTFDEIKLMPSLIQTEAISCSFILDQKEDKIEELIKTLYAKFKIDYTEGVELLTIRHFQSQLVDRLTKGKQILLSQKTAKTIQLVLRQLR